MQITGVMRLMTLSQGLRPVSDYTIEFSTLAAEVDWTEENFMTAYLKGLSSQIKDELISRDEPHDLETLLTLSILLAKETTLANKIDIRLCYRQERKNQSSAAQPLSRTPLSSFSAAPVSTSNFPPPLADQSPKDQNFLN